MSDENFKLPFGGAEGLLSVMNKNNTDNNNKNRILINNFLNKNKMTKEQLVKQRQKHDLSIMNVIKSSSETLSQCRPVNSELFHSAADSFTIKSPGAFCPARYGNNKRGISPSSESITTISSSSVVIPSSSSSSKTDSKLALLVKSNFGDEFVESLTLGPGEAKSIFQTKLSAIISKKSSSSNVSSKFLCPDSWLNAGATILECDAYYQSRGVIPQIGRSNSKATIEEIFDVFELEDIKLSVEKSLELVQVVNEFLSAAEETGGWWSGKQKSSQQSQQSTIQDAPEPEGEENNNPNNSTENIINNNNEEANPKSLSTSSSSDLCLLENLSGAFLAQVRKNLLEERIDYELSLFSDASFTVHFEKSTPPMINLPFFSNGRKFPANDRLQYAQEHSDMTLKTGGFPTFEFSGPQPGLFVSIFTKAVVGYSYVFTCSTGRAYGNGGAKENRFEFTGTESLGKSASASKKAAKKLPCRPLASAFGPRSPPPVRVAVPLCTSRYCRWYGIYHFMLEHLPQMTLVLDVLNQVPGAYLVVTENPSLTIRSLLVDALGIPKDRIIVGPVKAEVALLPTPGLVYRPLSHALRYFRRVILSRMGLEWRSSIRSEISGEHNNNKKKKRNNNDNRNSWLNPFAAVADATNGHFRSFERRFCSSSQENSTTKMIPEIRILFSERGAIKATSEQKQVRLPQNWQEIKQLLRKSFPCVRFQTEKEVREDVRDTIFAFYEADIVLGVHGANLLFTQFMRRGTHLIEMISADASLNPRCFYNLASEVGVKYSAILHDGGHKLKEYVYDLDPAMVVQRVNASMNEILENLVSTD